MSFTPLDNIPCKEDRNPKFRIEVWASPLENMPSNYTLLENVIVDTTLPSPNSHPSEPKPQVSYYCTLGGQDRKITQFVELEKWHEMREIDFSGKFFYFIQEV